MGRIDAYLDAMDLALRGVGDFQPRPFHIAEVAPYFTDVEAIDLYTRLRRLQAQLSDREVGLLFPSANSMKTLLMDLICGMKVAGIGSQERVWFVERIFDAMAALETGDIFCRDGTHRILTPQQAQELSDAASWVVADSTEAGTYVRAAYRASACGQAMVWALYFYAWTDMGWEIHGPYDVRGPGGARGLLVVRDYFDLAPTLLWPEVTGWPIRSMRMMTLHDPAAEIRFDVLNHATQKGSWPASSRAAELSVDGAPAADVAAATAAAARVLTAARAHHQMIDGMSRVELLKRFVASRYYAFRKWRTWFGDDWRQPTEIDERIVLHPLGMGAPAETGDLDLLRQAFDPRTDVLN